MGLKLTGPLRCGRCGKPRGITHVCAPGSRRRRRTTLQNPVTWQCGTCGKPRGLQHTCVQRTDFKARKRKAEAAARRLKRQAKRRATRERQAARRKATRERQAARRKQAAADRRARDKARKQAAKRKRAPRARTGDSHEPGTCGDLECQKYGCKAYWRGMADCPGPHEGG